MLCLCSVVAGRDSVLARSAHVPGVLRTRSRTSTAPLPCPAPFRRVPVKFAESANLTVSVWDGAAGWGCCTWMGSATCVLPSKTACRVRSRPSPPGTASRSREDLLFRVTKTNRRLPTNGTRRTTRPSQLLPLHHLRSWSCNLSQALSAVFLYSSIKTGRRYLSFSGHQSMP